MKLFRIVAMIIFSGILVGCAAISSQQPATAYTTHMATASSEYNSLWTVIRSGYQMSHHFNNPQVQYFLHYYQNHPKYIEMSARKARPFLYHIVAQVKARNMPTEIALLPFVESAYHTNAHSRAGAVGVWQLMPGTARQYNVKTNDWWFHGRESVNDSTDGALSYLSYLHNAFDGNWYLALAAYNAGEGTVSHALRYNLHHDRRTDYWDLPLPQQTKNYVPRLLAIAIIINDPGRYGITLPFIPNKPLTTAVLIPEQISFPLAARLAEVPVAELHALNPGFTQYATPPTGAYKLTLPTDSVMRFEEHLSALPEDKRLNWRRYVVRRGDTLAKISHLTGTSIHTLKSINHLRGNIINIGQSLIYPMSQLTRHYQVYHVRSGDNLTLIARRFGVSLHDLSAWNGLNKDSILHVGQRIVIH